MVQGMAGTRDAMTIRAERTSSWTTGCASYGGRGSIRSFPVTFERLHYGGPALLWPGSHLRSACAPRSEGVLRVEISFLCRHCFTTSPYSAKSRPACGCAARKTTPRVGRTPGQCPIGCASQGVLATGAYRKPRLEIELVPRTRQDCFFSNLRTSSERKPKMIFLRK